MNLIQLRQKFRELSGRFDLVNSDYSDNGADFFINAGSKFLDRLDETQKSWASKFKLLSVRQFSVVFPYCRAVKEVWLSDATNGRWQLEKKSLQDLIAGYLTGLPSSRTEGTPKYYAPCITRYIPEELGADDFEAFAGYVEVPSGNAHEFNAILLNVPVQYQTLVDIRGLFYAAELLSDTDENYWSAVHPMLLYMSAMRQVEISNRNTQGVNDWTSAITTEMAQLGMDLVEELISEANQMEG